MKTLRSLPLAALFLALGLFLVPPRPASAPLAPQATPDQIGAWSGVMNLPHVAIHSHLLPTGKVLSWDRHTAGPGLDDAVPWLWDPVADPSMTAVVKANHSLLELFCSAHVFLRDGRLFVAGGHNGGDGYGLITSHTYDADADAWTRQNDMNAGRWYPSATILANGDVCVMSGSITPGVTNELPQVYQAASGTWRSLTSATGGLPLFPMTHLAPNGKIFMVGPGTSTRYLDTAGTGTWTTLGNRASSDSRDYGASAIYREGKILTMGGAGPGDIPSATAEVIDLLAPAPAWRGIPSMVYGRRQMNAVVLADGKVLVTGGSSGVGFNNNNGAVLAAELWDPDTELFTTVASMAVPRLYHSSTVLLPDGRVLSQGGGHPAGDNGGTNKFNAEIYSPPYLFKGARPTIAASPARVAWGQTFRVETPNAASIAKVHLIRLTSVTHSRNMDQRLCRPSFAVSGNGLDVTAPASPNLCPPGTYLLFLVDGTGVPSVSKMIVIDTNTAPVAASASTQTLEATAPAGTSISLSAAGTTDPEGNIATYQWFEGGTLIASGAAPSISLGLGVHTIVLRVTDAEGLFSEATVTVTITDATAPVISPLTASPELLRPSDGALAAVTVSGTATDNADPAPLLKILSVSDADSLLATPPADAQITGNLTLQLRRERTGLRRRYAVLVEARDASGNASTRTTVVEVRSKWFP